MGQFRNLLCTDITMKLFVIAALLVVAAAKPSSPAYGKPEITIVSQTDVRNDDGSSAWSFAGSDGTTREESNVQVGSGYEAGNANKGSTYYISPEGQKITLTWAADQGGFRPVGDHLPTPPPIPAEIAAMLPLLPKLPQEPYPAAVPYKY